MDQPSRRCGCLDGEPRACCDTLRSVGRQSVVTAMDKHRLGRMVLLNMPTNTETTQLYAMKQEITNVLKVYENALNTSDTKAAMALYGSDPIFMAEYANAF